MWAGEGGVLGAGAAEREEQTPGAVPLAYGVRAPDGPVDAGRRGPGITRLPWVRPSEHGPAGAPGPSGAPVTAQALLREALPPTARPLPAATFASSLFTSLLLASHLRISSSLSASLHSFSLFLFVSPFHRPFERHREWLSALRLACLILNSFLLFYFPHVLDFLFGWTFCPFILLALFPFLFFF